jgi:hypothetical protein
LNGEETTYATRTRTRPPSHEIHITHARWTARKSLIGTSLYGSIFSLGDLGHCFLTYYRLSALHSFDILEARSPCYVIASHGYIVFCGLIALHGFAGWLGSSASQVAPSCLHFRIRLLLLPFTYLAGPHHLNPLLFFTSHWWFLKLWRDLLVGFAHKIPPIPPALHHLHLLGIGRDTLFMLWTRGLDGDLGIA